MEFDQILSRYRSDSPSLREQGTKFEELMARYLMTDPTYASMLSKVVVWNDFFARKEFGGQDTGIDLVAETRQGEYWAIQCKCYAEGHSVSKADMDTFLSTSGRMFHNPDGESVSFSLRLIIATTDNWSSNALGVTEGQTIPVSIVGRNILREAPVDWEEIEKGVHGADARREKYSLRPHQQEALDKALEHFKDNDRGKMIMACGTGKTFTSLRIAEAILKRDADGPGRVLFLAPSISLVGQTLREWSANAEVPLDAICVCSDNTVSKKRTEDDVGERVEDLGVPVTTDSNTIASRFTVGEGPSVVFSTYQSIDAVIAAQKKGLPDFDLVVCDEAHRTTGVIVDKESEGMFTKVHDPNLIHAKKRLYMTATPRLYGDKGKADAKKAAIVLCSMDDEAVYGKEFYNITFGRAVELGLLSDYKVLILTTSLSELPEAMKSRFRQMDKEVDTDTYCKIWGCLNALAKNVAFDQTLKTTDPKPMMSAVSFCRSIAVSKIYTQLFNEVSSEAMAPYRIAMRHIDGSMNSMNRDRLINWLKDDSDKCHILSNVRCLSEGVDVPALDAVMFMDSKGSMVDVVQSVGRVMRKAPGKMYGYIIIPVVVPDNVDPEDALDDNERYKVVWQVLRALRSHDERIEAEINSFAFRKPGEVSEGGEPGKKKPRIYVGPGGGGDTGEGGEIIEIPRGQQSLDDFRDALLARLVLKVGNRQYIEDWARDVARVMPDLKAILKKICTGDYYDDEIFNAKFGEYLASLRACVNDSITEEDAVNMLAQQIVTKPIFERLFGSEGFVMENGVSQTIDRMLTEINVRKGLEDIDAQLQEFYDSVERTLSYIDTNEGKQKVITALYEKFFKNAFPKDQAINGVVYTPIEIVDFILNSVAGVLKQEFGRDLNDEGVYVLDPFTGTGTFIARLLESGLISKENLERKYLHELFANEITLLAYYIAAVNIENTFARITSSNDYLPFSNILLTDTFNLQWVTRGGETSMKNVTSHSTIKEGTEGYFRENREAIFKENRSPITVIVGNPPYGATQKSANDDAKKRKYRQGIDARIESTYLDESKFDEKIGNVNSVYDNYIRAFRWATDRLNDGEGIIAFVTPSGWLNGRAFEGFRKCIEQDFSKIMVFNLRGDGAGTYKLEGDNVFVLGSNRGCKTGIAITLLVRHSNDRGNPSIYYCDIMELGQGYHVLEKRATISNCVSFPSMIAGSMMAILHPSDKGDWIVQRNKVFQTLMPLAGDTSKKFDRHCENTIFTGYSRGYATARDPWSYNFSEESVCRNMSEMLDEYTRQTGLGKIERIPSRIKWNRSLEAYSAKKTSIQFDVSKTVPSNYRPFVKEWFYNEDKTIDMSYQMPRIYPKGAENLTICVASVGDKKDFSCLITNTHTDLHFTGTSQCFPFYWYENPGESSLKPGQRTLFESSSELVRHDGISDWALNQAKAKYGQAVTKEDIFYYIYGYLHSPEYRVAFADDLKLSLPRIGFVDDIKDFKRFVEAGRKLANLHLNYESASPYPVTINGDSDLNVYLGKESLLRIVKMKLDPSARKLVYNQHIVIENIPEEAFRYIVNGRSALGWVVEQYQIDTDKESGITNDPNEYAGSAYILNLVLSIITVSVETMKIIDSLPRLSFDDTTSKQISDADNDC